jgi:hypothetical protein
MSRLIEVDILNNLPSALAVEVGDVLVFQTGGGHIRSGANVVEILGPFVPSILSNDGKILTPQGPPAAIIIRAFSAGTAIIDLVIGDPFYKHHTASIELTVVQ